MRGCGLRFSLDPHFDRPLRTVLVTNVKLGVRSCVVFLNERQRPVRLMLLSTSPVKKIALSDIARVTPDGSIFLFFGHGVRRTPGE